LRIKFKTVAGLYIHIPYCSKKCFYCDFYTITPGALRSDFVDCLLKEIEIQSDFLQHEPIESIHFGGGTPSLLSSEEFHRIVNAVNHRFDLHSHIEFAIEVNPENVNLNNLKLWKELGINRLSIGVQSFFDEDLQFMNRSHNANQAEIAIQMAKDFGFQNISIDLIYGFTGLNMDKWKKNIEKFLTFELSHLSAYQMTIEPKTVLGIKHKKGEYVPETDELFENQFFLLRDIMKSNGFEHYEISNWAKNGNYSTHNSNYWKHRNYLGIGPSAHSYNGKQRFWNVASLPKYIQSLKERKLSNEYETLETIDKYNEYILTSLRTMWGVDLHVIEDKFGLEFKIYLQENMKQYIKTNALIQTESVIKVSESGKMIADKIASDLFYD